MKRILAVLILITIGFAIGNANTRTIGSTDFTYNYDIPHLLELKGQSIDNVTALQALAIVPEPTSDNWTLTSSFAETSIVEFISIDNGIVKTDSTINSGYAVVWVCCNVSKGDRLYTNGGTNLINGTLTNAYNKNYKTRIPLNPNDVNTTWQNDYVRASDIPDVYNRRAALHLDGTQVAWAMESFNVSEPTPMMVKVI